MDIEDVCSIENAGHLLIYQDYNNAIDFIEDNKPLYGPVYSFLEKELPIF